MKPDQRIGNLEDFVNRQHYLTGLEFRVVYSESQDTMSVEFKEIEEWQISKLRMLLNDNMMRHIVIKPLKLRQSKQKQQPKQHPRRNSGS